ncbi:UNVERIFIED_CONTAM: RING-H2 finger protein ATL80 [Sesamum radiatum]|uniref:RING-H2 finger protein ATL80 n=1 Tax=Sesamum radiatum TaxID=300843 RepID=A0AAW2QFD8_SESRA
MTARSRLLGGVSSPPPQSSTSKDSSSGIQTLDSDFVVILAALLCALICVLGLVAVARCAWIRRIAGRNSDSPPSAAAANKGLKKKVLKSLPKLTYGKDNEQASKLSDCAICLADFATGEEIRVLPQCGHGFHVVCIDTWLGSHSSCPSCRQILGTARCQKCGRVPAASCSAAGIQPEPREDHVNRFLP